MIPMLGVGTYTVIRGTFTEGADFKPAYQLESQFEIKASIQPLKSWEMIRAPEGLRATHGIKFYAPRDLVLRTAEAKGPPADLIYYAGRWYEIHSGDSYNSLAPLPHVKYTAYASETARKYGLLTAPGAP